MKLKKALKIKLASSNLEEVFDLLTLPETEKALDTSLNEIVLLAKSRFERLKEKQIKFLINEEDVDIENNRIIASLISLSNKISDEVEIGEVLIVQSEVSIKRNRFPLYILVSLVAIFIIAGGYFFLTRASDDHHIGDFNGYWLIDEELYQEDCAGLLYLKESEKGLQGSFEDCLLNTYPLYVELNDKGDSLICKGLDNGENKGIVITLAVLNSSKVVGVIKRKDQIASIKGLRFRNQFSHTLNALETSNQRLGFRNKDLNRAEYRQINLGNATLKRKTLIGEIEHGAEIWIMEENKTSYKILTEYNGKLRLGYISKFFNGSSTVIEK